MKKAVPGAHSAKEVEGGTGVPVSGGQQYHCESKLPNS